MYVQMYVCIYIYIIYNIISTRFIYRNRWCHVIMFQQLASSFGKARLFICGAEAMRKLTSCRIFRRLDWTRFAGDLLSCHWSNHGKTIAKP